MTAQYCLCGEFDYLKRPDATGKNVRFTSWDFPGIAILKISGAGCLRWFVTISLLIPTFTLAVLTVVCYLPYRRARATWHAELAVSAED